MKRQSINSAHSAKRSSCVSARAGFTLLEIVLVVAVIAAIAAMTFPSLLRTIRDHEFKSQVENVRAELDGCRLKAVETGLVYQFRFEPAGQRFLVLPAERPDVGRDGATAGADDFLAGQTPQTVPAAQRTLTPNFRFSPTPTTALATSPTASASPPPVEKLRPEFLSLIPNQQNLNDVAWGTAILFFPDGSSSGGTVTVLDHRSQAVSLDVRPLTAAVTVHRAEQVGGL